MTIHHADYGRPKYTGKPVERSADVLWRIDDSVTRECMGRLLDILKAKGLLTDEELLSIGGGAWWFKILAQTVSPEAKTDPLDSGNEHPDKA